MVDREGIVVQDVLDGGTSTAHTQFMSHIYFIGQMMRSQHPPHTNNN